MLQGNFEDFDLHELLFLVAHTRKTGALEITAPEGFGEIRFTNGEIVAARSDLCAEPPARALVKQGVMSEADLDQGGDGPADLEALLDTGKIDRSQAESAVRANVEDAVLSLLLSEDAEFRWTPDLDLALAVPLELDIAGLLDALSTRLEEAREARQRVPRDEPVGTAPELPEGIQEISITSDEWQILAFIDGKRSPRAIALAARLNEFATIVMIDHLRAMGLVRVATPPEQATASAPPPPVATEVEVEVPAAAAPQPAPEAEAPPAPVTADPDEQRAVRAALAEVAALNELGDDAGEAAVPTRQPQAALEVIVLCTGNQIRSPIAEGFIKQLGEHLPLSVRSAGTGSGNRKKARPEAIEAAAELGLDISKHRPSRLKSSALAKADLVIGFEQDHVSQAIEKGMAPPERTFLITELVDALRSADRPRGDEPVDVARRAIAAANESRPDAEHELEILDPLGGPDTALRNMAARVRDLCVALVDLLFEESMPEGDRPQGWLKNLQSPSAR